MVSPQLSKLKIRVDHLVIGGGITILVVGALLAWRSQRPDPRGAELDAGLERMSEDRRAGADSRPPRVLRSYFESARRDDRRGPELPLRPPPNSEAVGSEEAITEFREVMGELEDALESGRKLGAKEEAVLYNRASGSLTAMSAWIDGDDPSQRALLEDAYLQMRSLMRELDIEPPAHDPDHNPLRR